MIKKIIIGATIIASPLTASAAWMKCTVDNVADFDKLKLQLMCKESTLDGSVNVSTFAIGYGSTASETARAARFFTMAQTALVSGKPMGIYFTQSATNASINCTGTCRVIDAFQMYLN
jgi:hypothetical protein